jgi:argininosuccinate synthase
MKSSLKSKVVLAYSGGLDTSVILKWLIQKGYDVICYIADVGQEENFKEAEKKALKIGASKVYIEDLKEEFVTEYIFPALKANAVYEGVYLLGTSLARPLIAKKQIEIAKKEHAQYVSHGATGKGNDQVRFELAYLSLEPKIKIISPWKTPEFLQQFKGRSDLLAYAKKFNIPVKASVQKPYSEDDNLMHISHEAGILEDPYYTPEESVFTKTVSIAKAPNKPTNIEVEFLNGEPIKVIHGNKTITGPLKIFDYLNDIGGKNGIGRVDMVENRFVGIKSRGIYENPAAEILWKAHRDIEGIAMDREVMHLRVFARNGLSPKRSRKKSGGHHWKCEISTSQRKCNNSWKKIFDFSL